MQTKTIISAILVIGSPSAALADEFSSPLTPGSITSSTYSENFDTLATSGTSNTLPTGWQIVENGSNAYTNGRYTAGTGSSNTGDVYSFGAAGSSERALGSLTSGSNTPILFGGVLINDLGSTITDIAFSYTGEQWRLGTSGATDGLFFSYSLDATSLVDASATWTAVSLLDFLPLVTSGSAGALNGNANSLAISSLISGLSIADGESFAFRWEDFDRPGSDHGLAVDNVSLAFTTAPTGAVPEPATWAMMIAGFGIAGAALRRKRAMTVSVA